MSMPSADMDDSPMMDVTVVEAAPLVHFDFAVADNIIPMRPEPTHSHASSIKEPFRNLAIKVHIRRPGRAAWKYMGRAHVHQEFYGQTSRVVIRTSTSDKVLVTFSESSEVQADKRGNFVVIASVEGQNVTSWSLNANNNSDALKLLASIELASYRCKQAVLDPARHSKTRRRVEKLIREDRRRRHEHKREEDELVNAFGQQRLADVPDNIPLPAAV